jgi:hypothetical protein
MRFAIRMAENGDREAIGRLVCEMMPGGDVERRLGWLYEKNPAGHALTWLVVTECGEIAGCTSFFPYRLQVDGAPIRAALGGDGFVRPQFRRHGLGGALHEASRKGLGEHGLACMYGAPGAMNVSPLKRGGSREVGTVSRWIRPRCAAAIGAAVDRLDALLGGRRLRRERACLEPMARYDARVDRVWDAARDEIGIGAVRNAEFYTWRFLDAPSGREPPYVIVREGRPIGACALERLERGRLLRVVDLVTVPGAWHAALDAVSAHAAKTTAQAVDIKLTTFDGRRRRMWRSGFAERERKPFLVMIPRDGDQRLVDPMRRFYGGADSDIDALEDHGSS